MFFEGLVRAGIKTLSIVDRDYIEFSNLQRQTLFTEEDANTMLPKVVDGTPFKSIAP